MTRLPPSFTPSNRRPEPDEPNEPAEPVGKDDAPVQQQMPPSYPPASMPPTPAPKIIRPPAQKPSAQKPPADLVPGRTSLTHRRPKKSIEPRTPTGSGGRLTIQTETPGERVVDRGMSERVQYPAPVPSPPAEAVSTGLTDRLEEVRAVKARHRRTRVGVVAGAIAALALVGWIIAFSPLLALDTDNITVVGASDLVPGGDVIAVAAQHEGTPLVRVDTAAIAAELQDRDAVKDADVVRQWPSGLHITVHARTPVAVTKSESGFTVLDGDGIALGEPAEAPKNLPLVDVPVGETYTAASVEAVLTVMDSLPAEILGQVKTAGAKNPDEVSFVLESGAKVVWGSAQESELKAAVLTTLLQVEAKVYNVAAPLSPITT